MMVINNYGRFSCLCDWYIYLVVRIGGMVVGLTEISGNIFLKR